MIVDLKNILSNPKNNSTKFYDTFDNLNNILQRTNRKFSNK
jgi:hypothetical protein